MASAIQSPDCLCESVAGLCVCVFVFLFFFLFSLLCHPTTTGKEKEGSMVSCVWMCMSQPYPIAILASRVLVKLSPPITCSVAPTSPLAMAGSMKELVEAMNQLEIQKESTPSSSSQKQESPPQLEQRRRMRRRQMKRKRMRKRKNHFLSLKLRRRMRKRARKRLLLEERRRCHLNHLSGWEEVIWITLSGWEEVIRVTPSGREEVSCSYHGRWSAEERCSNSSFHLAWWSRKDDLLEFTSATERESSSAWALVSGQPEPKIVRKINPEQSGTLILHLLLKQSQEARLSGRSLGRQACRPRGAW